MELTDDQLGLLQRLVRGEIRKVERGRVSLRVKFGDEYDGAAMDGKVAVLEELYRALGGDPTQITNRRAQ